MDHQMKMNVDVQADLGHWKTPGSCPGRDMQQKFVKYYSLEVDNRHQVNINVHKTLGHWGKNPPEYLTRCDICNKSL
jgi:hypothetical protein